MGPNLSGRQCVVAWLAVVTVGALLSSHLVPQCVALLSCAWRVRTSAPVVRVDVPDREWGPREWWRSTRLAGKAEYHALEHESHGVVGAGRPVVSNVVRAS